MKLIYQITAVVLLLLQGCTTYIKGDLSAENLSSNDIPFVIESLTEQNVGKHSEYFHETGYERLMYSLRSTEGKINPSESYTLDINYRVTTAGDTLMTYATMFTLGIIPLYSTGNADAHISIYKGETLVYKTKIDSRTHTYYGWWFIGSKPNPDMINWHEGAVTEYFKYEAIRDRIEGRLSKLMEDESVYNQILK